jgi:hypothetical protein
VERGRKKPSNQEVFFGASFRTGENDTRELDHEKKMQWEGVSNES